MTLPPGLRSVRASPSAVKGKSLPRRPAGRPGHRSLCRPSGQETKGQATACPSLTRSQGYRADNKPFLSGYPGKPKACQAACTMGAWALTGTSCCPRCAPDRAHPLMA